LRNFGVATLLAVISVWFTDRAQANDIENAAGKLAQSLSETMFATAEGRSVITGYIPLLPNSNRPLFPYTDPLTGEVLQFSGFHWRVQDERLTPADLNNGILWRGTVQTSTEAFRDIDIRPTYSSSGRADGGYEACWMPWKNANVNLQWQIWMTNDGWDSRMIHPAPREAWYLELGLGIRPHRPTTEEASRYISLPLCSGSGVRILPQD
jgi:hypothetical protein